MRARYPLALLALLVLSLPLAGCDSDGDDAPMVPDFDPATVDYDTITSLSYVEFVQPLLAARNVFDGAPTDFDALFASDAGAFLIPFDADGSILFRVIDAGASVDGLNTSALEADEVAYLRRWVDAGARGPGGQTPYADVREYALVCNQLDAKVSVIDIRRGRVIRTLDLTDLGLDPEAAPHDVESEPDGSAWYVALINENSVVKFSTDLDAIGEGSAFQAQTTPGIGAFEKPGMLAMGQAGTAAEGLLFAGRSFSDTRETSRSVAVIERATMLLQEDVLLPFARPHAIAQAGDYLLSSSLSDNDPMSPNRVVSIDLSDDRGPTLSDQVSLGGGAKAFVMFAVRPDGQQAALTSQLSEEVYFLDLSDPTDLKLDQSGGIGIIGVGEQPWHPTYSPDGATLYVPNRLSNSVSVIDVATQTVTETITDPALAQPHGSAITDDGRFLVVSSRNTMGGYTPEFPFPKPTSVAPETDAAGRVMANSDDLCGVGPEAMARGSVAGSPGTVTIIDTQTNAVAHVIEVGRFASGVEVVNR